MSIEESIAYAFARIGSAALVLGVGPSVGPDTANVGVSLIAYNTIGAVWIAGGAGANLAYDLLAHAELLAVERVGFGIRSPANARVVAKLVTVAGSRGLELATVTRGDWQRSVLGYSHRKAGERPVDWVARLMGKRVSHAPKRAGSPDVTTGWAIPCAVALHAAGLRAALRRAR